MITELVEQGGTSRFKWPISDKDWSWFCLLSLQPTHCLIKECKISSMPIKAVISLYLTKKKDDPK